MSITVYGIPNCDTCRKARKWLDARGLEHRFHDLRKDGIDASMTARWLGAAGPDKLINRRGTTWRGLEEAVRSLFEGDGAAAALVEHPAVIKRPVIERGGDIMVGFTAETEAALQGAG
jgi:arsenate reductase